MNTENYLYNMIQLWYKNIYFLGIKDNFYLLSFSMTYITITIRKRLLKILISSCSLT